MLKNSAKDYGTTGILSRISLPIILLFITLMLPRELIFIPIIYAAPVILTGYMVFTNQLTLNGRSFTGLYLMIAINSMVVLLSASQAMNFLLSLATYSGFCLLLLQRNHLCDRLVSSWISGILILSTTQVGIGTFQLIQAGFPAQLPYVHYTPDLFQGTYGPGGVRVLSIVASYGLFLSINMSAEFRRKRYLIFLAMLLFGLILPGANAVILAAVIAVGSYALYLTVTSFRYTGRIALSTKRLLRYVPIVVVAGIYLFISFGAPQHVYGWLVRLNPAQGETVSPKTLTALETLFELPKDVPYQPVFGLGLGNYSSWSQMLLSGVYVEKFILGEHTTGELNIPVSYRPEAWDYVLMHIAAAGKEGTTGIGYLPYFSWQSLYAEIGLVGLMIIGTIMVPLIRRCFQEHVEDSQQLLIMKRTLAMSTPFVVILCFTDNFLEYPWMTAPYFLGLALLPDRQTS